MYSNLKSDEKRRQEVISCLYWSLMQNWNIPQSMLDYFGLTEDYRLHHQLEDLERLRQIVASPDKVNDIIHIRPDFLAKYCIDRNSSPEECSSMAEKAYRELDARIVKMTGRKSYVEKQSRKSHMQQNPKIRGRKMGM